MIQEDWKYNGKKYSIRCRSKKEEDTYIALIDDEVKKEFFTYPLAYEWLAKQAKVKFFKKEK